MNGNFFRQTSCWLLLGLAVALVADPMIGTILATGEGQSPSASQAEPRRASRDDRVRKGSTSRVVFQAEDDDDDGDDVECEIDDDDGDEGSDGFCADQAIVRLTADTDIAAVVADFGYETIAAINGQQLYLLRLPDGSDEVQTVSELELDARVAWAELNFVDQAPEGSPRRFFPRGGEVPIPGSLADAYAPELIGRSRADCVDGQGTTVAVIDSGIDMAHPAFRNVVLRGEWNAFSGQAGAAAVDDAGNGNDDDGDGLIDEMTGHGTHVAGVVAQLAPGAVLAPIKALDSDGIGQAFFLAAAVYYAVDRNVDVVNLSLGSTANARIVREAITAAIDQDIFVAAAAGNGGPAGPREFPATLDDVFGVAATDRQDRPAVFTSTHAALDISAPGLAIVAAFPADEPVQNPLGSSYALWSGTSMATPWVAGAAALLLDRHPSWSAAQVAQRLRVTADPISEAIEGMGAGRLDVGAAVDCGPDADKKKASKDKKKHKDKKRKKRR